MSAWKRNSRVDTTTNSSINPNTKLRKRLAVGRTSCGNSPWFSPNLSLLVHHRIMQRANAFDSHFHDISRGQRRDALGRAGSNQIAGVKRHHLGDVADCNIERKDEIPRIALLPKLAVDSSFHAGAGPRIDFVAHQRTHGTERVEAFGPCPLSIFVLQVARSNIVHAGVAEDVFTNIFTWSKLVARAPDDNS